MTVLKQPAIVDLANCKKLMDPDQPFILVLKKGENLLESLLKCAQEMNIKSASLNGLGALEDISVAYYETDAKQYNTKLFTGMYELISLNGNISYADGKHFVHIHAALGARDYNVIGGHIMSATIGPTAEITVIPLASPIYRKYDEDVGLKLMCPLLANS